MPNKANGKFVQEISADAKPKKYPRSPLSQARFDRVVSLSRLPFDLFLGGKCQKVRSQSQPPKVNASAQGNVDERGERGRGLTRRDEDGCDDGRDKKKKEDGR